MTQVIIDTGPLVALLDDTDHHHKWAVAQLSVLQGPLFTCDAVLAEACYLLKGYPRAFDQLADYFQKSALVCDFSSGNSATEIYAMMKRYENVPMSFADACLVRMIELTTDSAVFTIDSDFTIYRQQRRRLIPLIAPF